MAPHIDDGKHEPVPKAVIEVAAFLAAQGESRLQQLLLAVPLALHGSEESVPAVGGKAHSKPGEGALGEAPAPGVLESCLPGGAV